MPAEFGLARKPDGTRVGSSGDKDPETPEIAAGCVNNFHITGQIQAGYLRKKELCPEMFPPGGAWIR